MSHATLRTAILTGFCLSLFGLACGSDSGDMERRNLLGDPGDGTPDGIQTVDEVDGTEGADDMASGPVEMPPAEPDPTAGPGSAQACNPFTPPADGVMIDFTEYSAADGSWGDTSVGHMTGGTSLYSCFEDGAAGCTAEASMSPTTSAGNLELNATIAPGGYSGAVLWFTPCVVPTEYSGFTMDIGGDFGGNQLLVKPQTSVNYPVDVTNSKGECQFQTEATKWSDCTPPQVVVTPETVTAEMSTHTFTWADFTGGVPVATLDPADGLLGLELQWQCQGTEPCALSVQLGPINFVE